LGVAEDVGVAATLRRAFTRAREDTEAAAREEVRLRLQALVENSSLTAAQFARRLGTSASRMSTYLTGKVVPSAALLVGNETVSNCAVQARSRTERMGVRGRNR
jgi:DNA-binding transcriptional regulator YiaG